MSEQSTHVMVSGKPTQESKQANIPLMETIRSRGSGAVLSSLSRKAARTAALGLSSLMLATSPALAQNGQEYAVEMCGSEPYNFMSGGVWFIAGASIMVVVAVIFLATAGKSLGWISRSISSASNKGLVYGGGAIAIMGMFLFMAALAYTTLPIQPPSECVTFF